jgi:hypothetical protein
MDAYRLNPEHCELVQKIAERLDDDESVFAFDDDATLKVGDVFENNDDSQLYKVAEVEHDAQEELLIVKASTQFKLGAEEFNELMHKLATMQDAETRHSIGDAVLAHTLKQLNPDYAYGVNEFIGMGKWYA